MTVLGLSPGQGPMRPSCAGRHAPLRVALSAAACGRATHSRGLPLRLPLFLCRSLMAFVNVPMIWQKLEVVRMVNCNLPEFDEEVDYGGIGELLLRSRVKVLEMTHTRLGDKG